MKIKYLFLLLYVIVFHTVAYAQYNLKVGFSQYLSIDPPRGYVRSATWSCDNGLTLTQKSEAGAVVEVSHYFTGGALVKCSYVFEYLGTYDNKYHASTGTKTYRITCIEGEATISETSLKLNPGQKYTLKCRQSQAYGKPTWSSSDENVAVVDDKGQVTAMATGQARITLDPIICAPLFCDVYVNKIDAKSMALSPNPMTIVEGRSKKMSPVYSPAGASASVVWTSENENIATVSDAGLVKGVSQGITYIVAKTDNGLSDRAKVEVVSAPVEVGLPANVQITKGFYYTLTPVLTPSNSEATYRWKTSDATIASVSSAGKVYGKKEGVVTITVTTDNNLSASTILEVNEPEQGIDKATVDYRVKTVSDLVGKILK